MNDEQRDEIARILEMIAAEGLPHPRNLDAALDAIAETMGYSGIILSPGFDHSYREVGLSRQKVVWNRKQHIWSEYAGDEHLIEGDQVREVWVAE